MTKYEKDLESQNENLFNRLEEQIQKNSIATSFLFSAALNLFDEISLCVRDPNLEYEPLGFSRKISRIRNLEKIVYIISSVF